MMSPDSITVLIAARNAAATIERAVRSAVAQAGVRIVLLDHASTDASVARARGIGGDRLRIVRVASEARLGAVRQAGLDALETESGIWLDADDEMLPGRCAQLVGALENARGDLAFDEIDLHDGPTGRFLRRLALPPFLRESRDVVRCFERNHLPGLGVPAFRTAFARRIGYDSALHGAEDYDFLLRALAARANICLVRAPLYRQFAYAASVSRQLENQRQMCGHALAKHDPRAVEVQLREAGLDDVECAWVLVSFFVFRGELGEALTRVGNLEATAPGRDVAPADERWRREFQRGTLLLALGRADAAIASLRRAQATQATAEGANNLGVALARGGEMAEATREFESALRLFPEYRDAALNRASAAPQHVTLLPLRRAASRADYS